MRSRMEGLGTTLANNRRANVLWDKELELIVRMDSTFRTWVQSRESPYNRLANVGAGVPARA
jgi:hypothetical protein